MLTHVLEAVGQCADVPEAATAIDNGLSAIYHIVRHALVLHMTAENPAPMALTFADP